MVSGSTAKKVVVERFDRGRLRGFVNPSSYLQPEGVELMTSEGMVSIIPYEQVKAVSFVRDLEGNGVLSERREFLARPKAAGLWVELHFRDGEQMEGLLSNSLLSLEPNGYSLTPPESAGNAQRVFVPKAALKDILVLGVVGAKKKKAGPVEDAQIRLFG